MIGLDTNVLARYYIDDAADTPAQAQAQREAARRLIEGGAALMVCKTVLLKLEWVRQVPADFDVASVLDPEPDR